MKFKSAVSLVLAFALCFAFTACRKIDKSGDYKIESQAYVVDEEGVSRVVQSGVNKEGVTEFFYVDSMGEVVTVKSQDVQVATRKVTTTAKPTGSDANTQSTESDLGFDAGELDLTPAQQEWIEKWQTPEAMENLIDENPDIELEISNDIIDEKKFVNETVAKTDNEGTPIHENNKSYVDFFKEIATAEKFTLKVNTKTISSDGTSITVPFTMVKSGKNMYLASKMPIDEAGGTIAINMVIKDKKCYLIIPKMVAYMEIENESAEELTDQFDLTQTKDENEVYVGTSEFTSGGKKYIVDKYTSDLGVTCYFYLNGVLKRIETTASDGTVTITEISEFTKTADNSKFTIPSYYMNMTDIMGGSGLDSLLS